MKFRFQLAVLFLIGSCLSTMAQNAASPAQATPANAAIDHAFSMLTPRPVVRVNGAELNERDLLREMYAIFPYAKQHNGGFPRAMEADIRRGALKMIEFEELVYQEALRRQMSIAPERLAKAERQFRKQFETEDQYQHFLLVEAKGSRRVIRTKIERSLLIEKLLKADVSDKSAVGIAEAKTFYLKNPERFRLSEFYALQTITIMPPSAPNAKQPAANQPTPEQANQMRARAEEALRRAKTTKTYEEFGILAETISEDDYRVMMGDHKAVKATELPAAILQVVSKLQPGEVSGLLQVEGTYTIVRLNSHNPARMQPFEEANEALRVQMQRNKTEKLRHALDAQLRKNAKIEEL